MIFLFFLFLFFLFFFFCFWWREKKERETKSCEEVERKKERGLRVNKFIPFIVIIGFVSDLFGRSLDVLSF